MTLATIARTTGRAASAGLRASAPVLSWTAQRAVRADGWPDIPVPPAGRPVDLPGRGTTSYVDIPGPTPDAPTVLLFHGIFTSGPLTWFSVLEELSRTYRVVTFDQRWHGRGIVSEEFTLDDCADDAAALLDVLGVERAVVAGYSMGGATAQVFVRRHPGRVAGLVLCSTASKWEGHAGERAFYAVLAGVNRAIAAAVHERVTAHRGGLPEVGGDRADLRAWALGELRTTSPWTIPAVLGELGDFDATGWLGDVDVPTAVVVTARDRAIPTERQRRLVELLPDPIVRESPGGHTSLVFDLEHWRPLFLEAVDAVVRAGAAEAL